MALASVQVVQVETQIYFSLVFGFSSSLLPSFHSTQSSPLSLPPPPFFLSLSFSHSLYIPFCLFSSTFLFCVWKLKAIERVRLRGMRGVGESRRRPGKVVNILYRPLSRYIASGFLHRADNIPFLVALVVI